MTWDDTNHGATQNGQWFPAAGTRVYASGGLDHQELNPYGGMLIGTIALLFIVPPLFKVFQYLQERWMPERLLVETVLVQPESHSHA